MPPTEVPGEEHEQEEPSEEEHEQEEHPEQEGFEDEDLPSWGDEDEEEEPARRSLEQTLGGTGTARAGVVRGILQGSLVFLVMALLALVVALAALLPGETGASEIARIAGLVFLGFHHVGIRADFPTFDPSGLPGVAGGEGVSDLPVGTFDVSFTVSVALMLGTLLALFLLYRAGRRAAEEGGGSLWRRAVQGASVAVPYAALSLAVAAAVSFSLRLPPEVARSFAPGGSVELAPSLLSAALWPLGLALLAGGLGGLFSGAPDAATPRSRRALAMVAGGGRMAAVLLLAGFLALLVLAALSPDVTAAYMERVTGGRSGLQLLLATVLVLPNLVLWGLTIGMGGGIGFGDYLNANVHIASLLRFPSEVDPSVLVGGAGIGGPQDVTGGFGIAPVGYFVFIPLAAVGLALAARRTAQRAESGSAGDGATVGAGSGVVFAVWFVLGILLAGIGFRASIAFGGTDRVQLLRLGPTLATGALVGLAWGAVLGALGGAMGAGAFARPPRAARRRRAAEPEAEAEELEETEELEELEELDLAPEPARASAPGSPPPPAVEVGMGPTGFEGLAAQQQAILRGAQLTGDASAALWRPADETEELEASEVIPSAEPEPPAETAVPTAEPEPPAEIPAPPAEPEPPEPEPEPEEDEDLTMPDPDQHVPDWLPEALRPEADEIDDEDLEERWAEEPPEEDDAPRGG